MAEWLCCLARTTKVLCLNLGAIRYRVTLDKSLTAVFLGWPGRCILITCDIHRPLWVVSVYGELKWLSGGAVSGQHPIPKGRVFFLSIRNRKMNINIDGTFYKHRPRTKSENSSFWMLMLSNSFAVNTSLNKVARPYMISILFAW
jgi:hypothetical protein